eukprot:4173782-Prymnesium_polylepis.1
MWSIELFDYRFFGIPRAEGDVMDPHQRVALEEGYGALQAAGLTRSSLMNSSTGVFGGIWQSDYNEVLQRRDLSGGGAFLVSAVGCSMLVGRMSYILGMQGPCVSFDTACSSSLSALNTA